MIKLELLTTKDDGSKVYKNVEMTVKKVNKNDRGVYGFIFNERPNEQDNTEWWNASSFTVKSNPEITQVKESDKVLVQLVHAPQINKDGVASGGFWNNVNEMHIVESSVSSAATTTDEVKMICIENLAYSDTAKTTASTAKAWINLDGSDAASAINVLEVGPNESIVLKFKTGAAGVDIANLHAASSSGNLLIRVCALVDDGG